MELAGAIVRNTRGLVVSSVSCLSDQLQAATPHTQRSLIKHKQHELLQSLETCLEEYVRRHHLDDYSGKLSSEVVQCDVTFRCFERHHVWVCVCVVCVSVCMILYCSLAGLEADKRRNHYDLHAGLLPT